MVDIPYLLNYNVRNTAHCVFDVYISSTVLGIASYQLLSCTYSDYVTGFIIDPCGFVDNVIHFTCDKNLIHKYLPEFSAILIILATNVHYICI